MTTAVAEAFLIGSRPVAERRIVRLGARLGHHMAVGALGSLITLMAVAVGVTVIDNLALPTQHEAGHIQDKQMSARFSPDGTSLPDQPVLLITAPGLAEPLHVPLDATQFNQVRVNDPVKVSFTRTRLGDLLKVDKVDLPTATPENRRHLGPR